MVHDLTRVIADCGGNIVESRMSALGSEFVMGLLISGNWHSLAEIETEIKKLGDGGEISVLARRTEQRAVRADMLPYSVDIVCLDQSGIVSSVSGFFSSRGVDIAELDTRSYAAAHTGAPMFSLRLVINVPSRIHLGVLREEFMDFCDHLNLDAILEPVKS
jgi:glycine cleavage system transcriptional repressor